MLKPTLPPISYQLQLLALLSLPKPTLEQTARAQEISFHIEDQSDFISSIVHHKIWPCAYLNIKKHLGSAFDQQFLNELKSYNIQNTTHYLRSTKQTKELFERLNKNNIEHRQIKGPHLAKLYPEPSLRHCGDIDILINSKDFNAAHAILTSLEYHCEEFSPLSPYLKKLYLSKLREVRYNKPKSQLVELHTRLLHYNTTLSKRYTKKSLLDPGLTHEDTFVYLCWHSTETLHHRIKWLCDLAIIIQNNDLNWEEVYLQAKKVDSIRAVTVCLYLAQHIYKISANDTRAYEFFPLEKKSLYIIQESINSLENNSNPLEGKQQSIMRQCGFLLNESFYNKFILISHRFKPSLEEIVQLNDAPRILHPYIKLRGLLKKIILDFIGLTKSARAHLF